MRRLDRDGEGGYWLNGARCRLTDVIEVLSDTGLGKETHSVISQGRVEAIVTSKPRDRRLLIEEAAGLGKHRKRRRRAQLKLERTQENLDRALDVEREARTRLRPLKRQAEAAELHERLERQMLEARWELAREALRARGGGAGEAEARSRRRARARARSRRAAGDDRTGEARPSGRWRSAPSATTRWRAASTTRVPRASGCSCAPSRSAPSAQALKRRMERVERELRRWSVGSTRRTQSARRRAGGASERERGSASPRWRPSWPRSSASASARSSARSRSLRRRASARRARRELEGGGAGARGARAGRRAGREARERLTVAEREAQDARREAARVGADLAAVNQFLRSHARPAWVASGRRS